MLGIVVRHAERLCPLPGTKGRMGQTCILVREAHMASTAQRVSGPRVPTGQPFSEPGLQRSEGRMWADPGTLTSCHWLYKVLCGSRVWGGKGVETQETRLFRVEFIRESFWDFFFQCHRSY